MAELDNSVAKSSQFRIFVQDQGSSPANPYNYVGCMSLGGFQEDLGTGDPIYCPSSSVPGGYDIVDTSSPPPSIPTTDFTQHMNRMLNDFYWDLRKRGCKFNMIIKGSNCGAPDDINDFQSKIIARDTKLTNFNTGAFNSLGEDAAIDLSGSMQIRSFDRFLPISFGEKADTATFAAALDGIYADKVQCGDCGDPSDGSQKAYVLTAVETASPSLGGSLAYTINGGKTWGHDTINSLSTLAGIALAQVGTRIVVISQTDLAHHYKAQSSIDAGSANGWTKVSGGYVSAKGPRAIWSKSPSQTYIAAAGGYVYLMQNPTSAVTILTDGSVTTQVLNDIRGKNQTVVAVGASNAVIASQNAGQTWALITGPAVGVTLNTIEVISRRVWFVGAANGKSFYTTNAGTTWTECTPDSTLTAVNKIRFVDEIVGYMAVELSGGVRIYRTADNGFSWFADSPYVATVPTCQRYNFIIPAPGNYNKVLAGGLKTSPSTDGIIVMGAA